MAPIAASNADASSIPLADHFFIAGIESSQIYDERLNRVSSPPPVEATIDEDAALETDTVRSLNIRPATPGSPTADAANRHARYSWEARKSIGSIAGPLDFKPSASNRSSATIKGVQVETGPGLSDEDFENALRKFANERESFLEEIQVSAGAVVPQKATRSRPKTVRISAHEDSSSATSTPKSGLGSGLGTIRRRLSTMNRPKRQPSTASRARESINRGPHSQKSLPSTDFVPASTRTVKRLSGYNSVIPSPAPFHSSPHMHPLKRRYEPVLLDRYPTKAMVDESKRRNPFPDYVPMFAFPNDVAVVSSDERPKATWHGFAMTNGDGSNLHAICVTIWLPLNHSASDELERQCKVWREANMSEEERELASSLGERLAGERAKLSRLLAQLPTVQQGSDEREALDDEISAVEEKITLMTDLLRPVRHGAASKIDGLTDGETGFWIPRVYGILGREGAMTSFWKEWLKAVVVPMTDGAVLRVPPSSPKVGTWQPLERYVVNLCVEAPSPMSSITQVEVAIRELRLYARKEPANEPPGSRNTDLYALFRALTIPNIITLFEYVMSEARVILLSSHTAMLHLASAAISSLLYPMKWSGVFIPVLPARLITALEAPCPYIVGVERRYESLDLPDDDFVVVDLDENSIESTAQPTCLPRQVRRKLMALLQAAAPHHNRYGVPVGPPPYAVELFPHDAFSSENSQLFSQTAERSTLASLVGMNSATFSESPNMGPPQTRTSVYNAFLTNRKTSQGSDRPSTSSTSRASSSSTVSPPSPQYPSPMSSTFPGTPVSRNDSGYGLQASLREKRSGHFDMSSRRNSSVCEHASPPSRLSQLTAPLQFGLERMNTLRRPSQPTMQTTPPPFISHSTSMSTSTLPYPSSQRGYAPSVYAPSTIAASTIMPSALYQPVRETETTKWTEGHCLVWNPREEKNYCTICDERCDDGVYRCTGTFTKWNQRVHTLTITRL